MIKPFIRQETPEKVFLCRAGSCCASLKKQDEFFYLEDDFGGKVKLDINDLRLLPEAVSHFLKD